MKMLTAKVVDGRLDVPSGILREGSAVTILVEEPEADFELSDAQVEFLRESRAQIARGEWISGEALLEDLQEM